MMIDEREKNTRAVKNNTTAESGIEKKCFNFRDYGGEKKTGRKKEFFHLQKNNIPLLFSQKNCDRTLNYLFLQPRF